MDIGAIHHIWLSLICGAGNGAANLLLERFGDATGVWEAGREELEGFAIPGSGGLTERLCAKTLGPAEEVAEYCEKNEVAVLYPGSPGYPERLSSIRLAPVVLYAKGDLAPLSSKLCVAMVGMRRMSGYGKYTAYNLARKLAEEGVAVVSGMASGIDSASHKGALVAGGYTAAVFGCGIDVLYPPGNGSLMKKIIEKGAALTEYPPTTEPKGHHFPIRNRIISGLAHGVVVVEADLKSGALITARHALSQGREVFAVPGAVNLYRCAGTNRLIRDGARIVTEAADVLDAFRYLGLAGARRDYIPAVKKASVKAPEPEERGVIGKIVDTITGNTPLKNETLEEKLVSRGIELSDDELAVARVFAASPGKAMSVDAVTAAGIGVPEALSALTTLEMYGLVTPQPGDLYVMGE